MYGVTSGSDKRLGVWCHKRQCAKVLTLPVSCDRPECTNLLNIYKAVTDKSQEAILAEVRGRRPF